MTNNIPKVIHYCWFGRNPLPDDFKRMIDSWKKYCPDYQIKEWNEDNFDIHCCKFVEQAYAAKKWAFVVDYVRFYALYHEGGIYIETDTEVVRPIDELLQYNGFFGFGSETMTVPMCGTKIHSEISKLMMEEYEGREFLLNGKNKTVNQTLYDVLNKRYGLINDNKFHLLEGDVAVFPREYFFSTDWQTGKITRYPELFVIHYAAGSWLSEEQKLHQNINKKFVKIFGERFGSIAGTICYLIKKDGVRKISKHLNNFLIRKLGPVFMKLVGRVFHSKKKIVLENFAGRGFGDNTKYVANALLKMNEKFDLVWLVNNKCKYDFPKGIRTVRVGGWRELYELATAACWIDNNRKNEYVYKNNKQLYVQTWHGFYPLKKIEKDAEQTLSKSYVENAKADSRKIDVMISGCKVRSDLYRSSFWYDGKILECGSPRNDIFFSKTNFREKVYNFLGLASNTKTVLYAPTFREDHSIDAYDIDFSRLTDSLSNKFGGNWVVLLKLHPAVRERGSEISLPEGSVDASVYDDIQELFCAADVLISDYSDVMFEYALTKKPVFLYASDMVEYIKERNFYYDIHELPFDISENNDELNQKIAEFDAAQYEEKINSFFDRIGSFEKGLASDAVAQYIVQNIK